MLAHYIFNTKLIRTYTTLEPKGQEAINYSVVFSCLADEELFHALPCVWWSRGEGLFQNVRKNFQCCFVLWIC